MTTPISDRLEHELGVVIHHGTADVQRVWRDITGHLHPAHYDSSSDPKGNPVSVIDTLRADFENVLAKAEQDAAKVERYEGEPLVAGLLGMLETVPLAREILTPVLAGVGKLAAMAPPAAPDAPPADVPADPAAPVDPQIQTGVAQ